MPADTRVRRVVVTSNVRHAMAGKTGGYFRVLDLEGGRVSFVSVVPESLYRHVDPNPRGGQRGGRGVSTHGGRLAIGNAERIFVFDPAWKLLDDITHPFMANIHEVLAEERGLWVAATGCDALLLVGWDGRLLDIWTFQDDEQLVDAIGLPRGLTPFDASQDYRDPRLRGRRYTVHINSVSRGSNGLLVGLGRIHSYFEPDGGTSAIVGLADDAGLSSAAARVLDLRPAPNVPNHNVVQDGDLLVFNDSNRGALVAFDPRSGEELRTVTIPGNPSFARGLMRLGPSLWLVGSQAPLAVYAVDLDRGEVVADYPLGGVEHETVFAIGELPDTFDDPSPPPGDDPYAFWRRAAPGKGMSPIPSRGGPTTPGRA